MNYEYLWKVLEELLVDLAKKGVVVPEEHLKDLRSAKTLVSIYNTNPDAHEIETQIESYLSSVESNLLYLAESELGKNYVDKFLEKVNKSRQKGLEEKAPTASKFVSGVRKGEDWVRIDIAGLIAHEELNGLLEKLTLTSKPQEDGYVLIHGKEENIRLLLKEISERIKKKDA